MKLEIFFRGEDGLPADVKLENFLATVVACIEVCCTVLERPPLMVAGA